MSYVTPISDFSAEARLKSQGCNVSCAVRGELRVASCELRVACSRITHYALRFPSRMTRRTATRVHDLLRVLFASLHQELASLLALARGHEQPGHEAQCEILDCGAHSSQHLFAPEEMSD